MDTANHKLFWDFEIVNHNLLFNIHAHSLFAEIRPPRRFLTIPVGVSNNSAVKY